MGVKTSSCEGPCFLRRSFAPRTSPRVPTLVLGEANHPLIRSLLYCNGLRNDACGGLAKKLKVACSGLAALHKAGGPGNLLYYSSS